MNIIVHAATHEHVLFRRSHRRDMRRDFQAAGNTPNRIYRAIVGIVSPVEHRHVLQRRATNEQTNVRFRRSKAAVDLRVDKTASIRCERIRRARVRSTNVSHDLIDEFFVERFLQAAC